MHSLRATLPALIARTLLTLALFLSALFPRTHGTLVVHAHDGDAAHMHWVVDLTGPSRAARDAEFHARHHGHGTDSEPCADPDEHRAHESELFIEVRGEPLRVAKHAGAMLAMCWTPMPAIEARGTAHPVCTLGAALTRELVPRSFRSGAHAALCASGGLLS